MTFTNELIILMKRSHFARLSSEKERQLALARERVAARRQKRAEAVSREQLAEQLAEESKNVSKRDGEF